MNYKLTLHKNFPQFLGWILKKICLYPIGLALTAMVVNIFLSLDLVSHKVLGILYLGLLILSILLLLSLIFITFRLNFAIERLKALGMVDFDSELEFCKSAEKAFKNSDKQK